MKVLFAASEVYPFAKSGGLADVAYSLPAALHKLGVDARVIMPLYSFIEDKYKNSMKLIKKFIVNLSWRKAYCGLYSLEFEGRTYYFVDNMDYFNRPNLYGYFDDGERFAFFSLAVCETLRQIDFMPDLVHINDWHTGLIPLYLKKFYSDLNVKTVLTIHNLRHQGKFSHFCFNDVFGFMDDQYYLSLLEFEGCLNTLKAGIMASAFITTVSPNYAEEIKNPYFSEGLTEVINYRAKNLKGILNGIPYAPEEFYEDGATEEAFAVSPDRLLAFKKEKKAELQRKIGVQENPDIPLVSVVTRLDRQKGLDLILHVLDELMKQDIQFVVLGTGEEKYESAFRRFASKYPNKFSANILFDSKFADQVYAGSDLFLMPSEFEPCGLSQLLAMHYGTVCVVRETGGLFDTVKPYNKYDGSGWGFSFGNFNAHELLYTTTNALGIYRNNKEVWNMLSHRAASLNFSFLDSAKKYIEIYEEVIG